MLNKRSWICKLRTVNFQLQKIGKHPKLMNDGRGSCYPCEVVSKGGKQGTSGYRKYFVS